MGTSIRASLYHLTKSVSILYVIGYYFLYQPGSIYILLSTWHCHTFYFCKSSWCKWCHIVLIYIYLITNKIDHLFQYFLILGISSSIKHKFISFAYVLELFLLLFYRNNFIYYRYKWFVIFMDYRCLFLSLLVIFFNDVFCWLVFISV